MFTLSEDVFDRVPGDSAHAPDCPGSKMHTWCFECTCSAPMDTKWIEDEIDRIIAMPDGDRCDRCDLDLGTPIEYYFGYVTK